jgi:tetratricopeptide (TPR) repeat protein
MSTGWETHKVFIVTAILCIDCQNAALGIPNTKTENILKKSVAAMTEDDSIVLPPYLWIPTSNVEVDKSLHRAIDEATEKLKDFSLSSSEAARLHFRRGSAYWSICQPHKADDDINKAIELDHSFGKAYAARAYRRLWDGKKADAQADVEKAIEVSPKDYAGYLVKAKVVSHSVVSCQDGIEKSREAIKLVSKAISLEPKLCDLYLTRAAYNSGAGQLDAGIQDTSKAIQLRPDLARAYQQRALIWKSKGDAKKEASDYLTAGELLKGTYGAYNVAVAAKMDLQRGDYFGALKRAKTSLSIDPKNLDALKVASQSLQLSGEHKQAISMYDRALALNPDDAELLLGKAKSLRLSGRKDHSDKILQSLLERCKNELAKDNTNAGAYYVRALVYEQQGKHAEAEADRENFKRHFRLQW